MIDPSGGGAHDPHYRMYIGNTVRKYTASVDLGTGPQPYVADVDADGKDDLLIMAPVRPDGIVNSYGVRRRRSPTQSAPARRV
jgi:hypothetical protein